MSIFPNMYVIILIPSQKYIKIYTILKNAYNSLKNSVIVIKIKYSCIYRIKNANYDYNNCNYIT